MTKSVARAASVIRRIGRVGRIGRGLAAIAGLPLLGTCFAAAGCDKLRGKGDLVAELPNASYAPQCTAADDTHVYWTASGHVFRVPRAGGPLEDFAQTTGSPRAIGVLGPDVVFIDHETALLQAKPKGGGPLRTIAKLESPPSLRCMPEDDRSLFASGSPVLAAKGLGGSLANYTVAVRIDKATGAVTELLRDQGTDLAIAIDATNVYVQSSRDRFEIRKLPKAGGAAVALNTRDPRLDPPGGKAGAGGSSLFRMSSLAVSSGVLYALGGDFGGEHSFTVPITGGVPQPHSMTLPNASDLVAARDGVCASGAFTLACFDRAGTRRDIGGSHPSATGLVVRGDDLYWFDTSNGLSIRHQRL